MKYLKSTSSRSITFAGKVVPANSASTWLPLNDSEVDEWKKAAVIASLIKAGEIIISDKEPAEMSQSTGALLNVQTKLKAENADLKAKIAKLEAAAQGALSDSDTAKALEAAQKEAAKLEKEKAALEKELKAQKKAYEALEKEAKDTIASLKNQKDA